MKFSVRGVLLFALAFALGNEPAGAGCPEALEPFTHGTDLRDVPYTLAIHQSNHVVSYINGNLIWRPASPTMLRGDARQYFSDRQWKAPRKNIAESSWTDEPFDPFATDLVNVSLDLNSGQLTMILKSWGNGRSIVNMQCDPAAGGVMYGIVNGAVYTLVLGN